MLLALSNGPVARDALLAPNLVLLCAARAASVIPLSSVGGIGYHENTEAFRAMVAQARQLGFRGAMTVYLKQVGTPEGIFAPTEVGLDWVQRVRDGARPSCLDGKMIDDSQNIAEQATTELPP